MSDDPSLHRPLKKKVGFALLSPEQRRVVAAKGGRAVPASARTFASNKALAATAGAKGGAKSRGGGRRPSKPI